MNNAGLATDGVEWINLRPKKGANKWNGAKNVVEGFNLAIHREMTFKLLSSPVYFSSTLQECLRRHRVINQWRHGADWFDTKTRAKMCAYGIRCDCCFCG